MTDLSPFFWTEHATSASFCLEVGSYLQDLFDSRANEGFEGNGYDWESLARIFLEEKRSDLAEEIDFDSEGSMFCAYSENTIALKDFALSFKQACADSELIADLFSRAELD